MWGAPVPKDIVTTDKLKTVFNTTEPVEVGKLYGSIAEGTARKLYQPSIIHPRVHLSSESIGYAIEWMQATLKGGNGLSPSDQTWYWKEFFTLLALIGMVILLFPVGRYLLQTDYFSELQEDPAPRKSTSGWGWWVGAIITILLPIPMYIWAWTFHSKGIAAASLIWPQWVSTTVMFWALGVAVISLVMFLLWHLLSNRKKGADFSNYGITWKGEGVKWGRIVKSFLLAFIVIFIAHLTLSFSDWAFQTDYRFWVFGIKPLDALHFGIVLGYIIPFGFYFLVLGAVLHGQMRPGRQMLSWGLERKQLSI